MSQFVAELCDLLITDTFGELYSLIFSYLLLHGRQPLRKIVEHTHLSPEQVRHGLVVLIQQHLIYHSASLDDGITYYEANWRSAYALVRSGKITQLVEERLGKYAAQTISVILNLGHVKVSDLEDMPELLFLTEEDRGYTAGLNGVNGTHRTEADAGNHTGGGKTSRKGKRTTDDRHEHDDANGDQAEEADLRRLHRTLKQLAGYGYIMRVREAHLRSPADNFQAAYDVAKASPSVQALKGKKLRDAIDEVTQSVLKEWSDGTISGGPLSSGPPRGIKRRMTTSSSPGHARKRAKLDSGGPDGYANGEENSEAEYDAGDDDIIPLDADLVVRVNYDKFDVSFRNRRLVELAEQHTTAVTSCVYDALLARIEFKTPTCRKQGQPVLEGEEVEDYSTSIPLHTVLSDIGDERELEGSIAGVGGLPLGKAKDTLTNGDAEDDEEFDDEEDGEDDDEGDDDRGSRVWQLQQHLSLLAQEPYHFAFRIRQSGMANWGVEFRHLARRLRRLELERLIEARFGSVAVRVIRVLAAKGRLDEKRLQEISMMASKDLRQILAQMEAAGFVDLQEVPRDAQRQHSRTIYLWFYDPDRVCTMVLEDIYKAMSRCLQRLRIERHKLRFLLEKADRTDVKANRERYLSAAEKDTLKQWQDKEALLLGEVGRLDEMVAVLRDY